MFAKGIGSRGDKAVHLEAAFAVNRGEAKQIQDELAKDGQIVRGMNRAGAHLIIAKTTSMHQCGLFSTRQC